MGAPPKGQEKMMNEATQSDFSGLQACIRDMLQAPRLLNAKTGGNLCARFGVDDPLDALGADRLGSLEPFELETLLSRMFPPSEADREACEAFLPLDGLSDEEIAQLVAALDGEGLFCAMEGGLEPRGFPIPEVIIARFVRLLRLGRGIDPRVGELIVRAAPEAERRRGLSQCRRSVWEGNRSETLLLPWLEKALERGVFSVAKLAFLGEFVTSYRPVDAPELIQALLNYEETCRVGEKQGVYAGGAKPHGSGRVRAKHFQAEVQKERLALTVGVLADLGVQAPASE